MGTAGITKIFWSKDKTEFGVLKVHLCKINVIIAIILSLNVFVNGSHSNANFKYCFPTVCDLRK